MTATAEDVPATTRFVSLRARLLAIVALVLVPWLVLVILTQADERKVAIANVGDDAMALVHIVTSNQAAQVEAARQLLLALARLPQLRGGNRAACSALMAEMLKAYISRLAREREETRVRMIAVRSGMAVRRSVSTRVNSSPVMRAVSESASTFSAYSPGRSNCTTWRGIIGTDSTTAPRTVRSRLRTVQASAPAARSPTGRVSSSHERSTIGTSLGVRTHG